MAENKETTKSQDLVEVTVLVDGHQHEGQPCEKGQKIKVTSDVKAWGQESQPQIFK